MYLQLSLYITAVPTLLFAKSEVECRAVGNLWPQETNTSRAKLIPVLDFLLCTYLIETFISPFPFGCLIYKDGNTIFIFTIVFVEPVALSFSQRHAFLKVSLESFYTDTIIS